MCIRDSYDIRRHVLQYDDVMNQQRNIIYGQRREVLEGGDMRARIQETVSYTHLDVYKRQTILLLILLSLGSVLWLLFSVRIEMRGVKPRVERGEAMMTIFTVRHTSLLPASALRIRLNVPSAFSASQEISVATPPLKTRTFRYMVRCPHRGSYEVGVTRMRARDVFGLFSISRKSGQRLLRVDVYPRAHDVPFMELKAGDTGPELRSRATEDTASPSDVRKWQEGDVLKKVHWKLTMRRRELMVRTFEESSRPDTLIVPDLSEIQALPDQALTMEDCVCEACLSQARAQLEDCLLYTSRCV